MIKAKNNLKPDMFIRILCLLGFMMLIFYFSSQNGFQSHRISRGVLKLLQSLNLTFLDSTGSGLANTAGLDFLIRKIAHFSLYFILALLFYWIFSGLNTKLNNARIMTVLCCTFYSITDEMHQIFVTGRTFHITDILIDVLGSIAAILLVFLLANSKKKRYLQKFSRF